MSDYRIAYGSNIALGSLFVFGGNVTIDGVSIRTSQPMSEGVKATRRDFSGDDTVADQGLYVELVWELTKDAASYKAILTPCGLISAKSAPVTVYCRDDTYTYQRYNGTAIRPPPSWQRYRPRNIVILVRGLVLL